MKIFIPKNKKTTITSRAIKNYENPLFLWEQKAMIEDIGIIKEYII